MDLSTFPTTPLPRHYLTDDEGVGGRLKVRPEDFLVDEQPLYELTGEGEHLHLGIEKTGVSHVELLARLRRHFSVPESAIGYAGMKDKHGVTRQQVSIHLHHDPPEIDLGDPRIKVLWAQRHRNKLRRGHLAGNRFSIRIRDVDPTRAPRALRILKQLEERGVPAYFGSQRFGYRRNNHLIGAMLIRGEWEQAVAELLGSRGTPFPEHQQQRRELFDAGRYQEAAALWTPADRSELTCINALAAGRSAREALAAVGRTAWSFWISAFQSAIFNAVLDQRLQRGTFDELVAGDLAWKHDSRAVFPVDAGMLNDPALRQRVAAKEVSPSGPLWGRTMTRASGEVDEMERAALEAMDGDPNRTQPRLQGFPPPGAATQCVWRGPQSESIAIGDPGPRTPLSIEALNESPQSPAGARRPIREAVRDCDLEAGVDEHGPFMRVAFDLPRGAYATIVLREIMKDGGT